MREIKVPYRTHIEQRSIGQKLYVLETIRSLDEAIDTLCGMLSPEEQMAAFAEDLCPYFGVLWPAGEGLARWLQTRPELCQGRKILELGCGVGLPSLVAKHIGAKVLATDFHPEVEQFFYRNCRHSSLDVAYQRLNWREEHELKEKFDIVMGSDILYEGQHPYQVADGLLRFVAKEGRVILADPGRNYLQPFLEAMAKQACLLAQESILIGDKHIKIFEFKA